LTQTNPFSRPGHNKFYLDRLLNKQVGSEAESPRRGLLLCHVKPACRACLCVVAHKQTGARAQAIINFDADGLERTEAIPIMRCMVDSNQ
jgi:hypothetical protein